MERRKISHRLLIAASQKTREKEYWLNKFWGKPVKSGFPHDSIEPAVSPGMGSITFKWQGTLYTNLVELSNASHHALHIILTAGIELLLSKYTDSQDITIATPIYKQENDTEFINTVLPLRNRLSPGLTFKELLVQVRQTIIEATEHYSYPLELLLEDLDLSSTGNEHEFPLFDVGVLLENIHDKCYILHIPMNMLFSFLKTDSCLEGKIEYNSQFYHPTSIERIANYLTRLFQNIMVNLNRSLQDILIFSGEEENQELIHLNNTTVDYPEDKTIHQLFTEQVQKTPGQIAVRVHRDLSHMCAELKSDPINPGFIPEFKNCCFKKNPYIFQFKNPEFLQVLDIFDKDEQNGLHMLRTQKQNYVAVNSPVLFLLDYFDGMTNVQSLVDGMDKKKREFRVYLIEKDEDTDFTIGRKNRVVINRSLHDMIPLIQVLYHSHLLELSGYDPKTSKLKITLDENLDHGYKKEITSVSPGNGSVSRNPVLLLGDRTGQATTGLLYIASFLRRNGIEAYCQWNDMHRTTPALKQNVRLLISKIQPKVVGVSLKWFPHIARVLEICKTVKADNPSIKVVVGGNTASYYSDKIINYEWVDYVVLGDGEVPFLHICTGEKEIPNCLYKIKENGKIKIIRTPITYIQDKKNSSAIFLSQLDKVFTNRKDPYLAPYFYINTGKGCAMQCLYCAGCKDAQKKIFYRDKPFLRGVEEVRKDLKEAKKYTSTFWFDFDLPLSDTSEYYKKLWEGLDLSDYFGEFYSWKLPAPEFIDFVVKTFKYVFLNIDLCSLSESHRLRLANDGVVKPQPTDKELLAFFDHCETYPNVEIIINQITGLPYFSHEDIKESSRVLSYLLKTYSTLGEMDWGRLHAQPGAPITHTYKKYNMHCFASTFEDFLHYSQLNLQEDLYPGLENFNYPYIYFSDDGLNSKISQLYVESNQEVNKYLEEKRKNLSMTNEVTYKELDEKSNQMACLLKQKGIQPEAVVGIMTERSLEMIIALLAVLKAGGAYLPLDPKYPAERLAYMLKNSRVPVLLTRQNLLGKLKDVDFDGDIITVDDPGHLPAFKKTPQMRTFPHHLAYILYTSGTTGKPKGVMVEHGSVVRLVKKTNYINWAEGDRLLLTGSIVFDVTTFEIWGSLLNGLSLYLVDESVIPDAGKMEKMISENRITILHLIPQLFNQLASQRLEIFAGLKYLMVGGDLVSPTYINQLRKKYQDLKILHMYGPTENTTFSTFFFIDRDYETRIPIGKPINNSTVYILDKANRLMPWGAVGEICTGGCGVARGYLNRVEITAEKFVRSPLSSWERLYKTGDRGRWLLDGNIEFLGRQDNQVKIRGIRIEPEEIENQLLKHEKVKEAVVKVVELPKGNSHPQDKADQYLCAYIVSTLSISLLKTQLREFLLKRVPTYMIPTHFIQVEQMPLTPNKKVDRNALPPPEISDRSILDIDLHKITALLKDKANIENHPGLTEGIMPEDKATLEKSVAYFTHLLQKNIVNGEVIISGVDIEIFPAQDRWQQMEMKTNQPLHQLFEEQVIKTPDGTAVICSHQQLTYNHLNEAANQLAHVLTAKGLIPNTNSVVGLLVQRSPEMVIGILGILKAGAAYIHLDPRWKTLEINDILKKNQVSFLITQTTAIENHLFTVLQNLTFNQGPLIRTSPRPQIRDFDNIPIPNRSLVNYEKYSQYLDEAIVKNCLSLQATRGCPYNCVYCHKIWPKKHVTRTAENVFSEIKLYYNMGVRRFSFIDDIFNLDAKNSSRVFNLIIKNGMDIQLHFPNGLRGDILTKDYIDLMVEAGLTNLSLALETASPRLQKMLGKNINLEKFRENLDYFCEKHPQIILDLFTMHGFPTETKEEALMTLDFIMTLKWLHFPYINILKIYPNSDMEKLALQKGVSKEAIEQSINRAYYELPETLPFEKSFTRKYQTDFLHLYVLSKERLLHVLPYQMKVLTEDEIVKAYRSNFTFDIQSIDDLLELVGITKQELGCHRCLDESCMIIPGLHQKMLEYFPGNIPRKNALRILLLDLSQFFSGQNDLFDNLVEPPLGLMYLLTYLNRELGDAVNGKIAKSMIDFDSYQELKSLIHEFEPQVIGIRALTLHQNFFHQTAALIRQWGFDAPIITGGPYATSSYVSILQDKNIDLVVLGEGEITFCEIIQKMIENHGKLPGEDRLKEITGIAFIPKEAAPQLKSTREIIMLDPQEDLKVNAPKKNLGLTIQSTQPAQVVYRWSPGKTSQKQIINHHQANCLISQLQQKVDKTKQLIASYMSGASLHQVFSTLQQGKILYIVPPNITANHIQFLAFYQNSGPNKGKPGNISTHLNLMLEGRGEISNLPNRSTVYVPPRNEMEKKMVEIWQEVLGTEQVGVNDNFFDLGGHSLNAIKIASHSKKLNIDLTVEKLFMYQTIDQIFKNREKPKNLESFKPREDLHEIKNYLVNHFHQDIHYQEYQTDINSYNVLYLANKEVAINTLREKLKTTVGSKGLPHYVKFVTSKNEIVKLEKPDDRLFARLLGLKTSLTPDDESHIVEKLDKNQQLSSLLEKNPVKHTYPSSPGQSIHLGLDEQHDFQSSEMILASYDFCDLTDSQEIQEYIIRLVNDNSLLRSIIIPGNTNYCIKEFRSFNNFELPFIDISTYSSFIKKKISKVIQKQLLNPLKVLHNLLYRVAALKLDESHYQIVFAFNHLIYDAESSFVLSQKIDNIRKGREDIKAAGDYYTYVNFMNNLNYDEIQLDRYLDIRGYSKAINLVLKNFIQGIVKYEGFELDISVMKDHLKDYYNEIIFLCYARLIHEIFELEHVPMMFVSYGRNYKDGNFSNIIGDFHDGIPVLLSLTPGSNYKAILENFLDYRQYVRDNNLNFKNYFIKKHDTGMNDAKLFSPFVISSAIGMYDIAKNLTTDEVVNQSIKQRKSNSPTFYMEITKANGADKLWINCLQNSKIENKEIKALFIQNYNHLVNDLNDNCEIGK